MRTLLALAASLIACTAQAATPEQMLQWQREVRAAECGFAASMAKRDAAAFERHLSAQTLFFTGPQPQRGPAEVMAVWHKFFEGPVAPFSWAPDTVEVNGDGSLAYTSGIVRNPEGEPSSRFNSVWRQEAPGQWRVVVDNGAPLRPADKTAGKSVGTGC